MVSEKQTAELIKVEKLFSDLNEVRNTTVAGPVKEHYAKEIKFKELW